ncbi:MAG: hypothetical protein [Caudoviricetes sp.]|nr:MAG: hypothetical protein [Caudoviricetes sp.]
MLNFEPNYWYVYIIRNNVTDWLYVGLHHQVSNKAYSNSSDSVVLKEAIETGKTSEYIVWKGKNAEKAAALETYLINLAKTNGRNVYNKNSGGGFKGGANPKTLTADDVMTGENIIIHKMYPKSVSDDNEHEVNFRLKKIANFVRDAVKDQHDGKSNPFKVEYVAVDEIINLPFLQIRENAIDQENVEKVIESMELDMKKAEYLVEPVSIVRFPNGNLLRADGTTTTYAVKQINKWSKLPVVYLESSLFNDNEIYMEVYASLRNRPEKHKGANDPKKQLKARIRNFHLSNQKLFDENIELFQRKFITLYNGSYSDRSMISNLSAYIRNVNENSARGKNWLDYKMEGGKILDELVAKVASFFPRSKCTHVVISSLENQAVGNAMHFFGNTAVGGKDTLVVLSNHSTHETENKEEYHFERLTNSFAEAGYALDKTKAKFGYVPFSSKYTGKKVYVITLPCRINTDKRITADMILEQLFPDDAIAA